MWSLSYLQNLSWMKLLFIAFIQLVAAFFLTSVARCSVRPVGGLWSRGSWFQDVDRAGYCAMQKIVPVGYRRCVTPPRLWRWDLSIKVWNRIYFDNYYLQKHSPEWDLDPRVKKFRGFSWNWSNDSDRILLHLLKKRFEFNIKNNSCITMKQYSILLK